MLDSGGRSWMAISRACESSEIPSRYLFQILKQSSPAFKQIVLTIPAYVWTALLQCLDTEERKAFESRLEKQEFKPDKKAIGAELKRGTEVPGADLKFGDWRLVVT